MSYRFLESIKKEVMDTHSDSRKRPLDSDGEDGMTKRSNQGNFNLGN